MNSIVLTVLVVLTISFSGFVTRSQEPSHDTGISCHSYLYYNRSEHIQCAIHSVLDQTYSDLEVVVVDDRF